MHKVVTQNARISVKEAIGKSGNEKLCVKLSKAHHPQDAYAIDAYAIDHRCCWAAEVTHVLHKPGDTTLTTTSAADKIAAYIEFLCMLEGTLRDGHVVSMSSLNDACVSIFIAKI